MRTRGYEYTRVGGRRRLVCARCRYPLTVGHNPPYSLPEPGMPRIDDTLKQATCGPCYQELYAFIYPEAPVPDVPDGRMLDEQKVPWEHVGADGPGPTGIAEGEVDEFDTWAMALDQARNSQGAETVLDAYTRLSGQHPPDVEITAPPDMPAIRTVG